ncbi:MAG: Thiol-disulfide oxidoreductase ResA [Acidobacteria bacterium]|nr:Thiol-disulfide oxidoreductase ResA [Acidobacteriota bacterium]
MFQRSSTQGSQSLWIRASLTLILISVALSLSCSKSVVDEEINAAAKNYTPPSAARPPIDSRINDYDIKLLDGGNVKMSNLVGAGKVTLVNIWATWCGPCRREIPDLVALHGKFKDNGVEVIGLTVDELDKENFVRAFAKQYSINYRIAFSPLDVFALFNQANGGNPRAPIPQSFVFDKNGKLIDSVVGLRPDFRAWAEGAVSYALKNS